MSNGGAGRELRATSSRQAADVLLFDRNRPRRRLCGSVECHVLGGVACAFSTACSRAAAMVNLARAILVLAL